MYPFFLFRKHHKEVRENTYKRNYINRSVRALRRPIALIMTPAFYLTHVRLTLKSESKLFCRSAVKRRLLGSAYLVLRPKYAVKLTV